MKKLWLLLISICFLFNFSSAADFTLHSTQELKDGHVTSNVFAGSDENYHYYRCNQYGTNVACTKVFRTSHYFTNQPYHKFGCSCEKCEKFFTNQPELKGKHWQYCSDPNCLAIKAEYHTGGTHENKGICQVCEAKYQTHENSTADQGSNEEYHWSNCSFAGCTYKTYQEHVKGTIQVNDYRHWYKCSVCQKEFGGELHESSTDFKSDNSSHWQYCVTCMYPLGKTSHTPDQGTTCGICRQEGSLYDDKQIKSFELSQSTYTTSDFNKSFTLSIKNKKPNDTITQTFTWTSSNPEVATVDENGKVTILNSLGTAVITATAINGVKADCVVYVGEDISLSGLIGPESIRVGESAALTPTFRNGGIAIDNSDYKMDYSVLTWTSEGTSLKVVDGFITGLTPSLEKAKITVTLQGKGSKTIYVKVNCREGEHSGGTHENKGTCILCGEQYQDHTPSAEWQWDETKHWQTCSGCDLHFNEGTHSGATHSNGGICTKCKYAYEEHGPTNDWTKVDDSTHSSDCTAPGCSKKYTEKHEDNNKDGKCDKCGHQFICTQHTGGTHQNGGKCTVCGTIYQNHGVGAWKWSSTQHYRECNICGEIDRANHSFDSTKSKCSICGYTQNGKCTHEWDYQPITVLTHTKVCKLCNQKIGPEKHKYVNGKCECEYKEPTGCSHSGRMQNLKAGETTHWWECPTCGDIYPDSGVPHTFSNGVCTICRYDSRTGNIGLDYELRINVYQSEFYIDKVLVGPEGSQYYEYRPIETEMDIICSSSIKEITAVSQSLYPGYDYFSNSSGSGDNSHFFYLKNLENKKLEIGLTESGKKSSKYFSDDVIIKVVNVNKQEASAKIRIIKGGDERARFQANILYPTDFGFNPGETKEYTIRAKTTYLYGNSSEEEILAFNNLDQSKLGRFIVESGDINVAINNTSVDKNGNVINVISSAEVVSIQEQTDDNGFIYYDIKVKVTAGQPGTATVVVTVKGKYLDSNGVEVEDFIQTRHTDAHMNVYNKITYTPINGGGSGGGTPNSDPGGGGSGNSGGGSVPGGVVGGSIAGIGALTLLALFIFAKKMSGH